MHGDQPLTTAARASPGAPTMSDQFVNDKIVQLLDVFQQVLVIIQHNAEDKTAAAKMLASNHPVQIIF
jgi:hypothetical protein